ncbi:nucleotide exchange factor GrpE [Neobacillus sp. SM06]|uniref:nucleotide exchange factor GrpE n=1 Tax=Neobacillus sp. SM06 TaxID=3422492 RepID=UPI003D2C8413
MTIEKDQSVEEAAEIQSAELPENESENETTVSSEAEAVKEEQIELSIEDQLSVLKEKNAELEKKLEEADNRYLRLQADFDNFRRRTRLEAEASEKYKAQKLITELLPAVDNFERALKTEVDHEQAKALLQGMEMVYRGLLDALTKEGLQAIEAVGKDFDPHLHQAVMQGEDENFASNTVIEEFQKGYMLKDKVIRPSMVKVNQ